MIEEESPPDRSPQAGPGERGVQWGVQRGVQWAARLAAGRAAIPTLALTEASRGELVDLAVLAERVKAWASSVQCAATAGLFDQFVAEQEPAPGREMIAAEEDAARSTSICLSLALGISLTGADRLLSLAHAAAEQPVLAEALASGRIDQAQAWTIAQQSLRLPPARRAELMAAVLSDPNPPLPSPPVLLRELADPDRPIWGVPAHLLRPILTRAAAELAPEIVEADADVAARRREVRHYPPSLDRPGALILSGPEELLAAAYTHLDHTARAARQAGDPHTLDQLRFDTAINALTDGAYGLEVTYAADPLGRPSQRPRTTRGRRRPGHASGPLINITMTDGNAHRTGAGADLPATLHTPSGDVPIPARVAREIAGNDDARWRDIHCDPATGTAVQVTPSYRPTRAMREFVATRDGHTTRFPTSAARTLELDHIREYDHTNPAHGGPTTPANLASTGKRDHQAKTDRLITLTGDANGNLTYTDRSGHTYTSGPHRYRDPQPPQPPDAALPKPEQPPDNGDPPY